MPDVGKQLLDDHEQINRLLRHGESMLRSGRRDIAVPMIEHFRDELTHHIELEVASFFEPFVRLTGDPDGAVQVMYRQHEEILACLQEVLELSPDESNAASALKAIETLKRLIEAHCKFEEKTLYQFVTDLARKRRDEADPD